MVAHLANVLVLFVANVTEELLVHLLRVRPQAQSINLELSFRRKKEARGVRKEGLMGSGCLQLHGEG